MAAVDSSPPIRWGNTVFLLLTPALSIILPPIYWAQVGFSWAPIISMLVIWVLIGMSITMGYHRLFSHRAYKTTAPVRALLLLVGGAAWQNSAVEWCSLHRRHHRHVDTDRDPYNAKRGFWWSHMGWILVANPANDHSNVRDLLKDPLVRFQHNHFYKITILINVGVPVLLGLIFDDVLGMLLFAGLVRVVIVHHFTFCINSVAHIFGSQPWSLENTARDSWLVSLITFGEGYHNYHHTFESDYRNGPHWTNFDPCKWSVWTLSRLGLAQDLRRVPADVIIRRRFDERRGDLEQTLLGLGQRIDTWREEVSSRASQHAAVARQSVEGHLVRAEHTLDTALNDMRAARSAYAAARRAQAPRLELQQLKKAARSAHGTVKAAFKDWEQVLDDWSMMAMPATA
jgi:stearoyl-CoA desaturase (delta-9 desaturase)